MIGMASHSNNGALERGQCFLTYEKIWNECRLMVEGVKIRSLDNVIRWLKRTRQITTRKTTRGFYVTISNYGLYQTIANYQNDTGNDAANDKETTLYNKELKEKIYIYSTAFDEIWSRYPFRDGKKAAYRHFKASVQTDTDLADIYKGLDNYLTHLGKNEWKRPKLGSTWFNNWRDWVHWLEPETALGGGNGSGASPSVDPARLHASRELYEAEVQQRLNNDA